MPNVPTSGTAAVVSEFWTVKAMIVGLPIRSPVSHPGANAKPVGVPLKKHGCATLHEKLPVNVNDAVGSLNEKVLATADVHVANPLAIEPDVGAPIEKFRAVASPLTSPTPLRKLSVAFDN